MLGALGLAGAATLPSFANAAEHPDARLIALCNSFIAGHDEFDALHAPHYGDVRGLPAAKEARSAELVDRHHRIRALVVRLPARTPDGLRAKAAMVERDLRPACRMPECVNPDEDSMPYYSLARDALALLGGRA